MQYLSLVSTRFNDLTWNENEEYRRKHKLNGCIYGSPHLMQSKILLNSLVFVVEMNNTKNRIEGIGLVKNKTHLDKYYKIYSCGNYNRYTYIGEYRLDRDELIRYNTNLVNILDHILFKEKTHLKRGSGFTTIPEKLLQHTICDGICLKKEIKNLFTNYFHKTDKKEKIENDNQHLFQNQPQYHEEKTQQIKKERKQKKQKANT